MSFDPWFRWIESTSLNEWIVSSPSLFAFPGILAAHTVGMGLLAGLNAALDFRLLGIAPGVPARAFARYAPLMWIGCWVNVLSGILLVIAYPTKAFTNPVFYLKLALIGAAIVTLRAILRCVHEGLSETRTGKRLAVTSLLLWATAITAGRLLAYTCTRLSVDFSCR